MMVKRGKRLWIALLIICLVVVLGGCSSEPAAAPKTTGEPIHIGVLGPMTGWATVYGENVVKGVQLALEEVDGKFQDRPIELHIEDTKAEVETMITKFDSLKQRDNCKIIIGPSLGHEGDATPDWAKKNLDVIVMPGYAAPQDMTMRDHTPNIIRAGWTADQVIFNFGQYVAKELQYKKVIIVGQDYAYPWGQTAGFKRGFLENGGEKVEAIWHPVEMLDFSSIMGQLQKMSKDYDAVMYNGGGAQVIAFWKAWEQYGMSKYYPQLLGGANIPDIPILKEVSDAFEGLYSSMHYADGLDIPANAKFKEDYLKKYNEDPDAIALQGYDTMRVILKALDTTAGKTEDVEALRQAILAVKIDDSPRGHFYFDENGQAVQDIYIKQVKKVDGKLVNVVVKTYKDVSQFGPYMAMPPDSRDYPSGEKDEYMKDIAKYLGQDYIDSLDKNGGWQ
jgi:branched-chain amino acid transport system substrate-binding protein